MITVKGTIHGDTVIPESKDIKKFDGKNVIITILDSPSNHTYNAKTNIEQFVMPSERGKNADEYIRNLREKDKL